MPGLSPVRGVSFLAPRVLALCSRGQPALQEPGGRETAPGGGAATMPPLFPGAGDLAEEAAVFLAEQPLSEIGDGPRGGSAKQLLLPYTDSEPAKRALEAVVELSSVLTAEVRVLHFRTWEPGRGARFFYETPEDAVALTRDAVERLRRVGLEASGVVRDAARMLVPCEIVARADQLRAYSIVLGARQHRVITAALLGSISRGVMRRANCPVIVVRCPRGRHGP